METIHLKAKKRDIVGKKTKLVRLEGNIPAVLYGHDMKPLNLTVDLKSFKKAFAKAGSSSLVDLIVDEKPAIKVLVQEPQIHPVSAEPLHTDFYKIKMTEKIETEIPLEFIGESSAVKDQDGNLITNKKEIKIKCLPNDLIPKIEVDVSVLKTFEDKILVKDLLIPSALEILDEQEDVVAVATPPRSEEELAAMEEEAAADSEKAGIEKMEAEAEAEKAEKEEEKVEGEEGAAKPTEGAEKKPEEKKPTE